MIFTSPYRCHIFSQLFMPMDRGSCGHLKASWDNHSNCLSCSSCSRYTTWSVWQYRLTLLWVLADKGKLHSHRQSTVAKTKNILSKKYSKKNHHAERSEDIPSDIHGSTTLHGYTAWGRTDTGDSSVDEHIIQNIGPTGTRQSILLGTR